MDKVPEHEERELDLLRIRWDRVILTYLGAALACGIAALIILTVIAEPIFGLGFAAGVVTWYLLRWARRNAGTIESVLSIHALCR